MNISPFNGNKLQLEQVVNFIAISETGKPDDIVCELIVRTLVVFKEAIFDDMASIIDGIYSLSSLSVTQEEVEKGIEQLIAQGKLIHCINERYLVEPRTKSIIEEQILTASRLEEEVRRQWQEELTREWPTIDHDKAWLSLCEYLCSAFRKHGLQTVALLGSFDDLTLDHSESLAHMLGAVIEKNFVLEQRAKAQAAVSSFVSNVGNFSERSKWIADLADATFHLCCLRIAPEVAQSLRESLCPLKLFLDTNVLFGVLDLHVHVHVDVSQQLLAAIEKYHFPFQVYYHEETKTEMRNTISYYGDKLRSKYWSQSLSRAAIRTRNLSGIELKYHEANAKKALSVESFLRRYAYFDELPNFRGIQIYRTSTHRTEERALLYADYQEFLNSRKHDKFAERITHDTTVLDTVRNLRTQSQIKSTLEAGALFVTSDYYLYKFDWEQSRERNQFGCVVLPSTLWQILRPFIPPSEDFDRIFAETFAIPEFRSLGSGSAVASSKMMEILAGYRDLPEELCVRMLSNDVLINQLKNETDEQKLQELVQEGLDSEAAELSCENAALKHKIEQLQTSVKVTQEKYQHEVKEWKDKQEFYTESLGGMRSEIKQITEKQKVEEREKQKQNDAMSSILVAQSRAEQERDEIRSENVSIARQNELYRRILAVISSLLIIIAFLSLVQSGRWEWLRTHNNSYGIQVGIIIIIVSITAGWAWPDIKKQWAAIGGATGVMFLFLGYLMTLLGGPK